MTCLKPPKELISEAGLKFKESLTQITHIYSPDPKLIVASGKSSIDFMGVWIRPLIIIFTVLMPTKI